MMAVNDDGSVILPAAVRAKIAAGKEQFKAQHEPQADPPAQQHSPVVTEAPRTATEPPANDPPPSPNEGRAQEPVVSDQTSVGEADNTNTDNDDDDQVTTLARQLEAERQRNRTLLGRMRVEQERRDKEMRELRERNDAMLNQLTELTARVVNGNNGNGAAQNKGLTKPPRVSSITDAERHDYGDGFVDMLARVAQEVADQIVAERLGSLQSKTDDLGKVIENTTTQLTRTKEQRRTEWLDTNLPNWQEIDSDPRFLDWLNGEDAFSGAQRLAILKRAMDTEDFRRIKLIFEGFVNEQGVVAPRQPPRPPSEAGRARLAAQALPNGGNGRVDAIVPDAPEAAPTPAEIKAYFDRKARNPSSLTEAEITRFESRLARGMAAGTIRGRPRI